METNTQQILELKVKLTRTTIRTMSKFYSLDHRVWGLVTTPTQKNQDLVVYTSSTTTSYVHT